MDSVVAGHTQERGGGGRHLGLYHRYLQLLCGMYLQRPTFFGGQERSELKTGKPFVVYYSESLTRIFPPPPSVPERIEYPRH